MVTRHYAQRDFPFIFTNGVQASYVEVDPDTGFVKLLKHWAVEDCGRVINPKLVDEQIRGAIVQGIGGALLEECLYDDRGLMINASMADYLVPMSGEMPDIEVGHVQTPTRSSQLGAKGAGEAGTAGAPAAVMNAINDALSALDAQCWSQPLSPQKILAALGKVGPALILKSRGVDRVTVIEPDTLGLVSVGFWVEVFNSLGDAIGLQVAESRGMWLGITDDQRLAQATRLLA
jgi:carbon-monoxide dehydrogenase large subunit